LLIDFAEFLQ